MRNTAALMTTIAALTASALLAGCSKPPRTIVVHEFHNAKLDRYFRTASTVEAAALRAAEASGESDTGKSFLAYPPDDYPKDAVPVCRFYGSTSPGPNSHFYTANAVECALLKTVQQTTPATQKRWNFEEIAFAVKLPAGGNCPPDAPVPIYRAYNNGFEKGADSNHRLSADQAVYRQMMAGGWIGEGVVMCVPSG